MVWCWFVPEIWHLRKKFQKPGKIPNMVLGTGQKIFHFWKSNYAVEKGLVRA
jgi:hypothetical protein